VGVDEPATLAEATGILPNLDGAQPVNDPASDNANNMEKPDLTHRKKQDFIERNSLRCAGKSCGSLAEVVGTTAMGRDVDVHCHCMLQFIRQRA